MHMCSGIEIKSDYWIYKSHGPAHPYSRAIGCLLLVFGSDLTLIIVGFHGLDHLDQPFPCTLCLVWIIGFTSSLLQSLTVQGWGLVKSCFLIFQLETCLIFPMVVISTQGHFWSLGIVVACVCSCVCVQINPILVHAITHHLFRLESPKLDQRC